LQLPKKTRAEARDVSRIKLRLSQAENS
jgi:hypothetical protein